MLQVNPAPDGFTVYDTDTGEAVIKFSTRAQCHTFSSCLATSITWLQKQYRAASFCRIRAFIVEHPPKPRALFGSF